MVDSLDGDIDFFDLVAAVLQRDTLAPYSFILNQDYILCTSIDITKESSHIENGKMQMSRKTMTDVDDLTLLANTQLQAKAFVEI